ncbi:MAG: EthD domain-containing protein [Mycobacterium sp.]
MARNRGDISDEEARRRCLSWPDLEGMTACTVHLARAEGPPDVVAVASLALDEARLPDQASLPQGLRIDAWLVDQRLQWDYERDWPDGTVSPGLKRMSFVQRRPGLTREQFADHWTNRHAPLAKKHHPGVWRYAQNVVIRPLTSGAADLDGVAELSFRTDDDMRHRTYDSAEGREVIAADVKRFIDLPAGWRVLADEHVLKS